MRLKHVAHSPYRALDAHVTLFGHLATAMVQALLHLERAGGALVAARRAAIIESWLLWALLGLSRELETLEREITARTRDEENHRARTVCLLSMLFTLLTIVRGIILRGACRQLTGAAYVSAPDQMLPAAIAPFPRPPAHARAAWYAQFLN